MNISQDQELQQLLAGYDYVYPSSAVAQTPARPRDAAKLLIYDRQADNVAWSTFRQLPELLPRRTVLVFNQTKVLPARLFATKDTSGRVEVLYLKTTADGFEGLANGRLKIGQRLKIGRHSISVARCLDQGYVFRTSAATQDVLQLLYKLGETPLPPYIKSGAKESTLRRQYQSIFAREPGSSAAPTASLHFTARLLRKLRDFGCITEFITLHVGLGTFAPLQAEQVHSGRLHQEFYEIDANVARKLNRYRAAGRPIIAVGTTVLRALEAAAQRTPGRLTALSGETDLFIRPPDRCRFVTGLITNFHVPRSSLMMLVASLIGRKKLLKLYYDALARDFRFFSFGDGMLIK